MAIIYAQYGKINKTEPVKMSYPLNLTCLIDGLYKGTIAFHFHTNAKIWTHRLKSSIPGTKSEKHQLYGVINEH